MIFLKLSGNHPLESRIIAALGARGHEARVISDARELVSDDILLSESTNRGVGIQSPIGPGGPPRWAAMISPSLETAIACLTAGAFAVVLDTMHEDRIARALVTQSDASLEEMPLGRITRFMDLFSADLARGEHGWSSLLKDLAQELDLDCIAFAMPGESPHVWPAGRRLELEDLVDVESVCVGLSPGPSGLLILGRTQARDCGLEQQRAVAGLCGGLMGQQLHRAGLLASVLRAKRQWEATVDTILDPIVIVDSQARVLRANIPMARLIGRPIQEMIGRRLAALCGTKGDHAWWEPRKEDSSARAETLSLPVAPERWFECHSLGLRDETGSVIIFLRDVTEERRLLALLIQKERYSAFGELADGVFHDLNNLAACLQPELACAVDVWSSLRPGLPRQLGGNVLEPREDEDVRTMGESLEAALDASRRLTQVLSNLRQYASLRHRRVSGQAAELDLNLVLTALPTLFRARARHKGVEIQMVLGVLSPVRANAGDMMRVFENLVKNAIEAVDVGGNVAIRSFVRGEQVCAVVSDTGCGIKQEHLDRIFERGFTTRRSQGGTGIGLYVCQQLLHENGGVMQVQSDVGNGTEFTVALPILGDSDRAISGSYDENSTEVERES